MSDGVGGMIVVLTKELSFHGSHVCSCQLQHHFIKDTQDRARHGTVGQSDTGYPGNRDALEQDGMSMGNTCI